MSRGIRTVVYELVVKGIRTVVQGVGCREDPNSGLEICCLEGSNPCPEVGSSGGLRLTTGVLGSKLAFDNWRRFEVRNLLISVLEGKGSDLVSGRVRVRISSQVVFGHLEKIRSLH